LIPSTRQLRAFRSEPVRLPDATGPLRSCPQPRVDRIMPAERPSPTSPPGQLLRRPHSSARLDDGQQARRTCIRVHRWKMLHITHRSDVLSSSKAVCVAPPGRGVSTLASNQLGCTLLKLRHIRAMRYQIRTGNSAPLGCCRVQSTAEVHGSRTHPRPGSWPSNRFEDGEAHRDPSTSRWRETFL
jgi:hypothetical protein